MNQIQLIQLPVIQHDLKAVGANVTARIEALNIDGQVATEDTVKSLKVLRADLNKELSEFEEQRKAVKKAVNNPYDEFDTVYKLEISDKYKPAIDKLKDKIAEVEDRIKSEKKANVVTFFNELCAFEQIDWLKFEQFGIEINLSTTEKAYKEKVKELINKVVDELELISTQKYQAEILVQYKSSLNAAKSIKDVQERKEAEKQQADRIRFEETNRRSSQLRRMTMIYKDIIKRFEFNENIFVTLDFVENSDSVEFNTKVAEIEAAIKAYKLENQPNTPTPVSEPLPKPVESIASPEEEFTVTFTVTGGREQLLALGEYMRANNINYTQLN